MSAIIRVALSRKELEIEPGQQGELSVTIQNLSEIVDQYILEIEGLDPTWATLSPPQLSLFPQDEGQVTVKLHPPRSARAATYPFALKVVSRENRVEWTRVQATLVVTPLLLFKVSLSPQRKSIVEEEATFAVQLTNPGNVDLTLDLSGTDPEEGCTYRFDPPRVSLEAGGSKEVPLTVTPKQTPRERSKLYTFTVKAAPADAPGRIRTTSGQLECEPPVVTLGLSLWPERRSAVGVGTFQVQLDNRGNTDLSLTLEGTDPGEACAYKFESPQVMVKAGESRQVGLTVAPFGQLPTREPQVYDFTVKAVPRGAPHKAEQVSGQFECRPKVVSFGLNLSPRRISTRRKGAFLVQLSNRGDSPLRLQLSAADPEAVCNCALATRDVALEAGESRTVPLIISPNKVPARGESTICGFNVEAVPDERRHLRKSVEGELEISRPKGRWRWIVPVVVALMLACVLVLVVLIVLYAVFYSDWGLISSSLGAL